MALLVGVSAGLLAGFSTVLVGPEPDGAGVASSEKFFFNHLDGKHMASIEFGEEGRKREGRKVVVVNVSTYSSYIRTRDARERLGNLITQRRRGLALRLVSRAKPPSKWGINFSCL